MPTGGRAELFEPRWGDGSVLRLSLRSAGAIAAALVAAAAAVTGVASPAAARTALPGATGFTISGILNGVAAPLANNAWAVGSAGATRTASLIVHWNGRAWSRVPRVPGSGLTSVAATSASNAWAVGEVGSGPLILHWNGRTWSRAAARIPAHAFLEGVAATSARNAWVVGSIVTSTSRTLILHWNGRTWARVPSPTPAGKNQGAALLSVAAVSATDAWAAGAIESDFAGPLRGLMLRWNGKTWKVAPGRVFAAASEFPGVAATSARNAWAIGCACAGGPDGVVTAHWNGSSWTRVAVPVPALESAGFAVAALAHSAWAVGATGTASLILGWNGRAWRRASHPGAASSSLVAVAATSARSAWAVGETATGKTLILHWNGRTWT
jgi:hypothetical protein